MCFYKFQGPQIKTGQQHKALKHFTSPQIKVSRAKNKWKIFNLLPKSQSHFVYDVVCLFLRLVL